MDTIVSGYRLAELLELPDHVAPRREVSPKARAVCDRITALMWSLPPDRREAFVAAVEAGVALLNERDQRRRDEEMMQ